MKLIFKLASDGSKITESYGYYTIRPDRLTFKFGGLHKSFKVLTVETELEIEANKVPKATLIFWLEPVEDKEEEEKLTSLDKVEVPKQVLEDNLFD